MLQMHYSCHESDRKSSLQYWKMNSPSLQDELKLGGQSDLGRIFVDCAHSFDEAALCVQNNMPCLFAVIIEILLFAISGHISIAFAFITLDFLSTCGNKCHLIRSGDEGLWFLKDSMLGLKPNFLLQKFLNVSIKI